MPPPPLMTAQEGVMATTLLPASRPTAVNCWVAPVLSEAGLGVTTIVASGPAVTLTVARPEIEPLVATTVLANAPIVLPAVNRPEPELIAPPPAATVQTGVMVTTLPDASRPTA